MKRIAAFLALLQLVLIGSPALAQDYVSATAGGARVVATESWVEEWDPATGQWVRIADDGSVARESLPTVTQTYRDGELIEEVHRAARYAQPIAPRPSAGMVAQYGPFLVTSPTRAQMIGSTDLSSPAQFDAMLRDFPEIAVLEMVEAPGTSNDIANLAVARRIRASGIATHVPDGGSVRSGAVEIFLAGVTRTMDDGALFAVHSWLDNHGREADDFPPDHSAHRLYLDFYVEMGMTEAQARDFYAMTNSVPHSQALWLRASDMRPWLRDERDVTRLPAIRFAGIKAPTKAAPLAKVERGVILAAARAPIIDYGDLSMVTLAQLDILRPQAA